MNKLLIIGFTWPEPNSTAAGSRMMQLIHFFQSSSYEIIFASTASKNENSADLKSINVESREIQLNDSSFDVFLKELAPKIVMFDRFLTEEQFGWRVVENAPQAIRILDTEDLHFLRNSRLKALKSGKKLNEEMLTNDLTIREISSILRCDLSLIISKFEMKLLKKKFHISKNIIHYLPFLSESITSKQFQKYPSFNDRKHFMTIGNFKHEPNWLSVLYLKKHIWPLIREKLPTAEIHIYGSYATEKVLQLNNPKEGFLIKGWAKSVEKAFSTYRVCLAPLEAGAGLKGKLLDAMTYGTPSVTTSIGAEGMQENDKWNGFISNKPKEFSEKAITLYLDKMIWGNSQQTGKELINGLFSKEKHIVKFKKQLEQLTKSLEKHRTTNFYGNLVQQNTMKSTKYLAKWIEEKNKKTD